MSSNGSLIPHSRPTITAQDLRAVEDVLRSGMLAQGNCVKSFEEAMATSLGKRDGVATSSGTAALYLALRALDIGEGDEVVLPSYTCVALVHAVHLAHATPVLADIDKNTFNISPDDAARRLTRRTKAIIVPHMFGRPAELESLLNLGVPIIEDCAQSLGALYRGRTVGSFGVLAVCSFYATKVITTGEGGMVLSDSIELLDRVRDAREYDRRSDTEARFNFKMTEFAAALGLSQLQSLDTFITQRRQVAAAYESRLGNAPAELPYEAAGLRHIFYRYVVRCANAPDVADALRTNGVESPPPVFKPLHHLIGGDSFPETDEAARTTVSLPIYPGLTDQERDHILAAALDALGGGTHRQWDPFSLASSAR